MPLARKARARSPLAREKARIRAHFRAVLAELCARDVGHLPEATRARRARLVAELERYARAGRFPRNLDFPAARMPYFVDAFGTRCAMAHLIESTGESGLVARVAATANNAFVRELEADLALGAWLDTFGLTAAEAARIQPTYCFVTKAEVCFCTVSNGGNIVVEGTVLTAPSNGMVKVRLDAVHGGSVVAAGQEMDMYPDLNVNVGDAVLGIVLNAQAGNVTHVVEEGFVRVQCAFDMPPLKTADAVAALLKGPDCSGQLGTVDPTWRESQCEEGEAEEGGCALAPGGGASPLLLGSLVLAAAVFARRRMTRRRLSVRRAAT
jgi:hypothetical protein